MQLFETEAILLSMWMEYRKHLFYHAEYWQASVIFRTLYLFSKHSHHSSVLLTNWFTYILFLT